MELSSLSRIAQPAALLLPVLVAVPLIAGFLGAWHPAFDSFAHFRAHLAFALALASLPSLFFGYRLEAATALLLAVCAFATTLDRLPLPGVGQVRAAFQPKDADRATYRLLHLNLRFNNPTPERVLSLIGRTQPDVVTLNEVSQMWRDKLALISATYPYRLVCDAPGWVGGAAILSRRPFADGDAGACDKDGLMARVGVDFGGERIDMAAMHLSWPWPFEQPRQIDLLREPLKRLGGTALVAGDLNATSWSAAVRQVAGAGHMTRVEGIGPTWLYRRLPKAWRPWIGLPIDQIFAKGRVTVHSARVVEDVGSDHAPVLVEFSLAPRDPGNGEPSVTTIVNDKARAATSVAS